MFLEDKRNRWEEHIVVFSVELLFFLPECIYLTYPHLSEVLDCKSRLYPRKMQEISTSLSLYFLLQLENLSLYVMHYWRTGRMDDWLKMMIYLIMVHWFMQDCFIFNVAISLHPWPARDDIIKAKDRKWFVYNKLLHLFMLLDWVLLLIWTIFSLFLAHY